MRLHAEVRAGVAVRGPILAVLALPFLQGCRQCDEGQQRDCHTCCDCAYTYQECTSDGRWGECQCAGATCCPVCHDEEPVPCQRWDLPDGCCDGVTLCLYWWWTECFCTSWCAADAGPDASEDPDAPDVETRLDVVDDGWDIEAETDPDEQDMAGEEP